MQDRYWLEDVGDMCISTLDRLNAKVQKGMDITHEDKVMQDVCLGYLLMLSICNDEGVFVQAGLSDNLRRNITLH
tara:strand:- start:192 stop:416 length:225 start_codon:yes stop_codon:yes gene_type:complete